MQQADRPAHASSLANPRSARLPSAGWLAAVIVAIIVLAIVAGAMLGRYPMHSEDAAVAQAAALAHG